MRRRKKETTKKSFAEDKTATVAKNSELNVLREKRKDSKRFGKLSFKMAKEKLEQDLEKSFYKFSLHKLM